MIAKYDGLTLGIILAEAFGRHKNSAAHEGRQEPNSTFKLAPDPTCRVARDPPTENDRDLVVQPVLEAIQEPIFEPAHEAAHESAHKPAHASSLEAIRESKLV